ncbi:hypothetical protein [Helicobacter bilis]|uniref:hypothetical protein n=1 Tax=Helicobacter bilis TaxID=37372 RepID=UPI000A8F392A|nr:hypothetical protein [Helicobacter bilis]
MGDKNGALQGEARELPESVMTEAKTKQSPFLAPKPTQSPKTESYALCFAALLIVIICIDVPQITLLAQNLIRTQKPHKNAMVLIVILKAAISPDEIQVFKAI